MKKRKDVIENRKMYFLIFEDFQKYFLLFLRSITFSHIGICQHSTSIEQFPQESSALSPRRRSFPFFLTASSNCISVHRIDPENHRISFFPRVFYFL